MSKIEMNIALERVICEELSEMRKMHENRDYSGLMAAIERVQHHANRMESGLWDKSGKVSTAIDALEDKDLDDKAKVKKARRILKGKKIK